MGADLVYPLHAAYMYKHKAQTILEMGNMKVWTLLVVAIWVCWFSILVVSARDRPLIVEEEEEEDTLLRFSSITFDTKTATKGTYRNFMRDLRVLLKDNAIQRPDGIPVTRHSVPDGEDRYVIVLIGPTGKRVSLALDVVDLYVVGYRDIYNNKDRAHFFPEASSTAKSILFKGADRLPIPFGGAYRDLEAKAGARTGIELGIGKLQYAIESVFGLPPAGSSQAQIQERNRVEATFLIIAIQMVTEAARFKYIEEKVLSSIQGSGTFLSFKPDACMTKLETNWDQLSKAALQGQEAQFKQKLQAIGCPVGENSVVDYMGILKYSAGAAKTEDYISFLKLYDIVSTD